MINQILQSLGSHLWSLLRPSSLLVEILLLGLILHGTRWRSLGHKLILGGTLLLGLIAVAGRLAVEDPRQLEECFPEQTSHTPPAMEPSLSSSPVN